MKAKITMIVSTVLAVVMLSCSADYKKTKSGLVYKIFSGGSKDSVAKFNNVVKFNVLYKINDSVLYDNHGKMPEYFGVTEQVAGSYSPFELFTLIKKGDSVVVTQLVDTLFKKGMQQQLPFAKKGDQIKTYIKILEVFRVDSIARKDYEAEMIKDRPRQEKEAKEMQAKQEQQKKEAEQKAFDELKKSGEWDAQQKVVEDYLVAKKIKTTETEIGTHIFIKQKGSGEPVTTGKFLTIKYTGKLIPNDSVFESSSLVYQIGMQSFIRGWEDGMYQFNNGGSGSIYMPGYLAYGKNIQRSPNGKPDQPMLFDVELLGVSDSETEAHKIKQTADSIVAAKPIKKTN